jgi:hypothetical protein
MKTLKNTIRKNLLEVKETKKVELIDSKIVENRFNKIVSESENRVQLIFDVLSEEKKLRKIGLPKKVIKENLMDLIKVFYKDEKGVKIIDSIKDTASEDLIKKLNLETNGLLSNCIVKVFKDQPTESVSEIFSDCDEFCNKVAQEIVDSFGIKDTNRRETITKSIKLELKLIICPEMDDLQTKMENKFSSMKEKMLNKD